MRIVNLDEASRILGITPDAIRKRIQRGTMQGNKDPQGKWKVVLEDIQAENSDQLVEYLRGEIEFLRKQIQTKDLMLQQKDLTIHQMMERVPLLEGPKKSWWDRLRGR